MMKQEKIKKKSVGSEPRSFTVKWLDQNKKQCLYSGSK